MKSPESKPESNPLCASVLVSVFEGAALLSKPSLKSATAGASFDAAGTCVCHNTALCGKKFPVLRAWRIDSAR